MVLHFKSNPIWVFLILNFSFFFCYFFSFLSGYKMSSSSSFTSPLCTWIVAACMSFTCGSRDPHQPTFNKRLSTRRRKLSAKCSCELNGSLVSSFCGSSIQGLMSSYLAFEPCNEYYSSRGTISSLGFFADNGLSSFFGSKTVTLNRKQRRLNRATYSGNFFFLF